MATREPTARWVAPVQLATSRFPWLGWPVVAVPLLAFALAFALDVATERRYSQIWGSLALAASAGVVPAVRRAALPVGACVGVWVGFNALRAVADDAGMGLVSDRIVSGWEAWLFGGELPSATVQRAVLNPTHLGPPQVALTAIYLSFFIVPHVVAALLLVRNKDLFWRAVIASALLFAAGIIAFAIAPTDPPWMAASGDPSLGDVKRLPRLVLGELGVEFGGTSREEQGYGFEPNSLASMPSIHLGVTVLLAAVAWQGRALWRWTACGYAVAMGIALVVTGEHYVLDVIAGALMAVVCWTLAGRMVSFSDAIAPVPGAPERSEWPSAPEARLGIDRAFGRESEHQ
jgi:membrane-associated phospholipid phosphatase